MYVYPEVGGLTGCYFQLKVLTKLTKIRTVSVPETFGEGFEKPFNLHLWNGKITVLVCQMIAGSAVPEGATAYVLSVEGGGHRPEYRVWNASTGESYSYRDNYCPLQSIGCVVNADNVSTWVSIILHNLYC